MTTPDPICNDEERYCDQCLHVYLITDLKGVRKSHGYDLLCSDCLESWKETACMSELELNQDIL